MMKNMLLNEDLMNAERAFKNAESSKIIELCKEYLRLLTDYRD